MTAVVVGAAAALRLSDPERDAEALSHALREGRQAVEELDRLVTMGAATYPLDEVDIDRLLADHGVGTYHRSGPPLSAHQARLVYRVVREALTNAARYAEGAGVEVRVRHGDGRLVVTVVDGGGRVVGEGLGSGTGLAGLDAAVRAAGGVLGADRHGDGWRVCAEIPSPRPGRSAPATATMRGDRALVVLAAGLSLGVVLLPSAGDRDLLSGATATATLLVPLLSHSATLAWRRTRPLPAFGVASGILCVWVLAGYAGWTGLNAAEAFLASWWIELMLVYSIGAYGPTGRPGWWAPGTVSVLGGAALAEGTGIHGNRLGVAVVLAVLLLPLTLGAWWAGRVVAGTRRRRAVRDDRARTAEQEVVAGAASSSRAQLGQELRRDARRHAMAVVAAATDGRLTEVLAEGRATLTALRVLVHTPAEQVPEPPPSLLGLEHLATRRYAALVVTPPVAPLPAALEVLVYRAVAAVLDDGALVEVRTEPSGVDISVVGGRVRDAHAVRRLRDIVDAADGRTDVAEDEERIRIWLPRTPA